jgi:pilus assembly protein Flp/PilA
VETRNLFNFLQRLNVCLCFSLAYSTSRSKFNEGQTMDTIWHKHVRAFLANEDGPTAVEYAIMLALILGMLVSAATYVGSEARAVSDQVVNGLEEAL